MHQSSAPPSAHLHPVMFTAAIAATVLAGAIAGIGMAASFHTVSAEMTPGFGRSWAWTVPATLDLAVAAFSLLEVVLVRLSMPHLLARAAVYAATVATIYLNMRVVLGRGHAQELAHAAMPAVWITYIELLRGAAKTLAHREQGKTELTPARWLLDPIRTFRTWRRSVLEPQSDDTEDDDGQFPTRLRTAAACGPDLSDNPDSQCHDGQPAHPAQAADTAAEPLTQLGRPPPGRGRGHSHRRFVDATITAHPEWSTEQIAAYLGISPRTVRRHRYGR